MIDQLLDKIHFFFTNIFQKKSEVYQVSSSGDLSSTTSTLFEDILLTPDEVSGMFKDWNLGGEHIINDPKKNHALWISNGRSFFKDYRAEEPLLIGLSEDDLDIIWDEYENELKRRAKVRIEKMKVEVAKKKKISIKNIKQLIKE